MNYSQRISVHSLHLAYFEGFFHRRQGVLMILTAAFQFMTPICFKQELCSILWLYHLTIR